MDQTDNTGPPPSPPLLNIKGSPYYHSGYCNGDNCKLCYKYACSECGFRSNRILLSFEQNCPRCNHFGQS